MSHESQQSKIANESEESQVQVEKENDQNPNVEVSLNKSQNKISLLESTTKLLVKDRFPKDISIRKKWLNACGLKENDILKNTRICGNHFSETCFHIVNTVTKCRSLIKGSVPSLLLLNKKSAKRKLQFSDGVTSLECSKIILEQEPCSPIIDVIAEESL
ncbi:hypothetical protein FQA39_LY18485 [Lamprigera yunnana]|nr:hypothetical protein FQA39_LY18485 [Lamprigera yunnana]